MVVFLNEVSKKEKVQFDGVYKVPTGQVTGTTMQEWIDAHFQSIAPSISVGLSPSNALREYGNDITDPFISVNITLGSNPTGTITDIKYYRGTGAGLLLHSGTETSYQDIFTVSSHQRYTVAITDSEGRTASANKSYSFVYPFFWGLVSVGDIFDGITSSQIQALPGITKYIETKSNKSFSSSPIAERYCFAYPASYGNLNSIIDANGFETISDYDVFNYNIIGLLDGSTQAYKVYILKGDTTQINFSNTYSF